MTTLREAAQQALEALEYYEHRKLDWCYADEAAITALRAALAEEALQRLTDANQEIEAVLGQPEQTCNCRWVGDVQTQQCTLHEAHVDAIHEWAERAKAAEAKLEQPELKPKFYAPRRLSNKEVWALIESPRHETEQESKFTLSCGCPSQYGGVPAYWERDGSTAFGMICEKHWHEYGARAQA